MKKNSMMNENILCFGTSDWDFLMHPDKHTMLELSKKNRILYIEPIASFLSPLRSLMHLKRWVKLPVNIRKINSNFHVYSHPPMFLPFVTYHSIFSRINGVIFAKMVNRILRKLNFEKPIIWSYLHHYEGIHLIPKIKRKLFVYDCVDQYTSFTFNAKAKKYIQGIDKWMCENADLVFTVSKNLLSVKRKYNMHAYFIPNAVNLSHFKNIPEDAPVPYDIAEIKSPVIGLIGMINFKKNTDVELIKYLATIHPEWSIVLIGPVENKRERNFPDLSNVYFLGTKKVEKLPFYIKKFDVCIMPYLINDFTKYNCPQKLVEYFASGKPVVTTDIPACREFKDVIKLSNSNEEFASHIVDVLQNNDNGKSLKRIKIAEENTWENRVAEKSHLVVERLRVKESCNRNL